MKTKHLNKAIENAECDECNDEVIGFSGKYRNYEVSFHGESEDDFKVILGNFGSTKEINWDQEYPNKRQLAMMQQKIDEKRKEFEAETELEEIEVNDPYEERGLSEGDFINYNLKQ